MGALKPGRGQKQPHFLLTPQCIEITGNESKVEKFIELMKAFGVTDITRTGKIALPRK